MGSELATFGQADLGVELRFALEVGTNRFQTEVQGGGIFIQVGNSFSAEAAGKTGFNPELKHLKAFSLFDEKVTIHVPNGVFQ